MRIGLTQLNPTVGDIGGNAELILDRITEAEKSGCHLTIFPELALTGYPPEDLVLKPAFIKDNLTALKDLTPLIKNSAALIGYIDQKDRKLFNAAAWIEKGKVQSTYRKICLPNYGVFDEQRYFEPGSKIQILSCQGIKIALTICEDIWTETWPLKKIKSQKPDLLINISASPFHAGKLKKRTDVIRKTASTLKTAVLYCNMVGGQDELVFDGGSLVVSPSGKIIGQFPQFKSGLYIFDVQKTKKGIQFAGLENQEESLSGIEEVFEALVLGIRDYVNKNGFQKTALGLSGGIDSSLTAALAVEALGPDRVVGVTMPSQYNLSETRKDAVRLAENLGIRLLEIPIKPVFDSYLEALSPSFKDYDPNTAEENIQARIRGNLLMALSNKFGWLILTTGNKSELSVGYCTLYGDMAGGFAVLKDVLKKTVYDLSKHINQKAKKEIIPQTVIDRPPTAELRKDQKDEDSLGPYAQLDPLIVGYVEENLPLKKLIQKTHAKEDYARKIVTLVDRNEYKRRQSPPGIKITPRAFGRDHRMPITNRYKQN